MFKVIVAGSRGFNNYLALERVLDKLLINKKDIEIVSGTARGADKLGEKYAEHKKLKIAKFPAQWNKFGKSAGYKRNAQMADYADACVVFWDGESRGTKHMIDLANKKNLQLRVYNFDGKVVK